MSLILDALNRAESERKNQNAVPDLNTFHHPQELGAEAERRPLLWWAIGGALVLIALVVALVILLRREPPTPVSLPASTPSPRVVVEQPAVVPTVSAPIPAIEQTAAPAMEKAPPVAATTADVDKLYAAEDAEPVAVVDRGVNELYAAEAAIGAASETIVDPFNSAGNNAAVSISGQEPAPPRTFDSIKNIPDFNDLPWNMRQQIPTISYARHNYLAGGVSSVVINNQTSGAGNIIGTGQFIVQEIYVDGVILKHGNAVFKLRALNGWINM